MPKSVKATILEAVQMVANKIKQQNYQNAGDVAAAIDSKLGSVYIPKGSCSFAELPTPSEANLGFVYNLIDAFTTTVRFVEGEGINYPAGSNVVIVKDGENYKYDVLSGMVDLSNYVKKETGKGLSENNFTNEALSKLSGIENNANNYSLPLASSTVRGGAKIGYTANGKNYPVQLADEKMFVTVPWTDNNTTYSAATATANGLMSKEDKAKLDNASANLSAHTSDNVKHITAAERTAWNGKAAANHTHTYIKELVPTKNENNEVDLNKLIVGNSVGFWKIDSRQYTVLNAPTASATQGLLEAVDFENGGFGEQYFSPYASNTRYFRSYYYGSSKINFGSWTKIFDGTNAVAATKLANARKINGVGFDGTADITLPNATAAANGLMSKEDKAKLDKIVTYFSDKGTITF